MRKFWVIAALFPLLAVSAKAQTEAVVTPKTEWFAKYSFARIGNGSGFDSTNFNWGWNTAAVANVNRWLGVMADFSGHYGHQLLLSPAGPTSLFETSPAIAAAAPRVGANIHTFMLGPRFTYRHSEKYTPFFHTLFGAARIHRDTPMLVGTPVVSSFTETSQSVSTEDWPFALKVGGGVDVKLSDKISYRPFEVNYLLTRPNENSIHNLELSTGFVLRFGAK